VTGEVGRGRRAFGERAWNDAYEALDTADRSGSLGAEDLERLALAAYLVGRDEAWARATERAHQAWSDRGDADRAARCAFWLGLGLLLRGEVAQANGWFGRGRRLVAGLDCPARGYLLVPVAIEALARGAVADAHARYEEVAEIAERFDDTDLLAIGMLGRGEAMIASGNTSGGLALLDEVMVAATTGEVSPLTAGILYCAVIEACVHAFDLRRAAEWTGALTRWCADQPGLVPFRGQCLVHRSQVMQANGEWGDALAEASNAEQLLSEPPHPALGVAFYQQGELHRLRSELDAAERAYRQASQHGRDPVPGLALLKLATGDVESAAVMARRMLDEADDHLTRLAVLPSFVEIMLAARDRGAARAASDELVELAAGSGTPFLEAVAAHARGSVLLADGDPAGALTVLRRSCELWRDLGVPYERARSQELVGLACRALGDGAAGEVELEAAAAVFERLGAVTDRRRIAEQRSERAGGGPAPGMLSVRECEVLRLVAQGRTNRAIGAELVISEHTVARHVQNIFTKLGVSSRAAATAFAYEHGIV
jgi:DNA-binding CsgD family transcriptional regulator